MSSKERLDVFISSTSFDLPEHRNAVAEVLNTLRLQPVGMEYWAATGDDPVDLCKRQVEETEAFIGIYAHRYGWCPPGYGGKSITEMEYDWAQAVTRNGMPIPRLCFVMDDSHPITADMKETETDKAAALMAFKARVTGRHIGFFKNVDDLKAQVIAALASWVIERQNKGLSTPLYRVATSSTSKRITGISADDRGVLLRQVREFWVEGVLEKAKIGDEWLDIIRDLHPAAVEPTSARVLNDGDSKPFVLTPDTPISDLFKATGRALLILGAPGAGKTIALLELAKDLIAEAEIDSSKSIPVVLNLASWAEKRPKKLETWLIERLDRDYGVSKEAATRWIADGDLLFLLDGLDEVAEEYRDACVTAINTFWKQAGDWADNGIVVCSRIKENDGLRDKLKMQMAIQLEALTLEQAQRYVAGLGIDWEGLKQALNTDGVLQSLASSPLLLNIMVVAYRGESIREITGFANPPTQQKHLFDHYVARYLREEKPHPKYSHQQTRHYLAWLARQMTSCDQTIFHIENIQMGWLSNDQKSQESFWRRLLGIAVALVGGTGLGLGGGLVSGLLGGVISGLGVVLGGGKAIGLGSLENIVYSERISWSWRGVRNGLVRGLVKGLLRGVAFGTIIGLVVGLALGLSDGLIVGLIVGLVGGLVIGLVVALSEGLVFGLESKSIVFRSHLNQSVWRSIINGLSILLIVTLVVGLILGLLFGLVSGLVSGLSVGLVTGLLGGLSGGFGIAMVGGLRYGLGAASRHAILRQILWRTGDAPLNYAEFLRYTTKRNLMRQVGGGFVFRHRSLMEHFAASDW